MFGDLEKFDDTGETRTAGEPRCDVGERHLEKRCHHDLPWGEGVMAPYPDVRPLPQPDSAGDLPATDSVSQGFEELHVCGLTDRA
jgi:hypothetical protein